MAKRVSSLYTTRRRIVTCFVAVVVLFGALFGRLAYIQIFEGKELQTKAAEQWYRDLPLVAPRGKILDANGAVLADNKDIYTVYVRPKAVTAPEATAIALDTVLENVDYDTVLTKIKARAVSEITVARQVEPAQAERLIAMNLDGVYFTVDSKRNYPEGNFLTQVLGFTNIDNVGQNGLEGYYDTYLTGTNGFAYTPTDIKGVQLEDTVTRYVPAIAGSDIQLTIDASIQAFAAEAVMTAQTEFSAKSTSMIVMDAKTGGVLAMAITPSFDLNDVPRNDIDVLNALSKNTLMVDVYEPGSTFKIFTTAAAIEYGVTSDSKSYFCPGYRIVDGQRIRCWRTIGHGTQLLGEGVKNSCNCIFMDMALSLGTEKLYGKLRDFGFGAKSGIDFFGESSGILMRESSVKTVDLARIGFGQAIACTPLQLAAGVCAAVNGGSLYQPYFVKNATSASGENFYSHQPNKIRQVISTQTSAKIRELLTEVVANGSGRKAQVAGFSIGGKTGTAQKYKNGVIDQGKYVSSFVGFAPADDPEYVILTIVDEPSGYLYYGSIVAAPATSQVFKKIFDYKGITPAPAASAETVTMPELTGADLTLAIRTLESMGLCVEIAGDGLTVENTLPIAGTVVPKSDVVLIRSG